MPIKIIKLADISRDEWLSYRRKGIGGSDAATVVGLNPYRSLYELWADKQGLLPEKEDTEAMRVGRDLETYVASRFCEATGKKVERLPYLYAHEKYPFITANIDRKVVGENSALECKTTSVFNRADFENGEVPATYLCQCYHYMNVMGYDKMYLAVLILGKGFYWYEIPKNEEQQEALLQAEITFWQEYIEGNSVPSADGSSSAEYAIAQMYLHDSGATIPLHDIDSTLEQLASVKKQLKALERKESELKQQIQQVMKEASAGYGSNYKVTWKNQTSNRLDSKKLKEEQEEIYQKYVTATESRVFKITEIKENEK